MKCRRAHTWRPDRFMVIAGHPDDADFGPAGTAARWIDEGSDRLARVLHERRRRWRGSRRRSARAGRRSARRSSAPPPAIIGYAGVSFLHLPDGALVNDLALREQLVREIRTFRPDAVLATDPDGRLLPRRRDQPHRPSRGGDGRGRRRLSGGPQPDGVPGARPVRPGGPHRPPALPLLAERAERPRRHQRDPRAQDRRPARPRQPDQGAGEARRADPRVGGRGGRADRRRRRPRPSGWS